MPNLKQVVDVLETLYPLRYAEQWDEPGLIVGDPTEPVRRIAFAADPTDAIVDKALAMEADLLVTHHPLFFRSVHEVSGLGFRGNLVSKLNRGHCALWVGHTNADAAWRGVGQAAADSLRLVEQRPLVPLDDPKASHPVGLGRIGVLEHPMTLGDFAMRVAQAVHCQGMPTALGVQMCGDPSMPVHTVAVLPGSGDSLFDEVRASDADVYVTSDLRHHPVTDAIEQARYEARVARRGVTIGHGDLAFINTPHAAIESIWFNYALEDVPNAIERATGERPGVAWIRDTTDPWCQTIHWPDTRIDVAVRGNASADRDGGAGHIGDSTLRELDASCDGVDMNVPATVATHDIVWRGKVYDVDDMTIDLHRTDGGTVRIRRQITRHRPCVVMLVHDVSNDKYLMEREYRAGSQRYAYGLPAGLIDEGEDVDQAALRELREETGVVPEPGDDSFTIDAVGDFYSSEGMSDELAHIMVIHLSAWRQGPRHFDPDEHVESAWVDFGTLTAIGVTASNSQIALLHEALRRAK